MAFKKSVKLKAEIALKGDGSVHFGAVQRPIAVVVPDLDSAEKWTIESAVVVTVTNALASVSPQLFGFDVVVKGAGQACAQLLVNTQGLNDRGQRAGALNDPLLAAWIAERELHLSVAVDGESPAIPLVVKLRANAS